ncbi:MAG TPA: CpsD/CapB family tyrosine-protein kinase [Lacipirellulaceae bacterium]|jgi:Mrp family chromosome partitioning ATPase
MSTDIDHQPESASGPAPRANNADMNGARTHVASAPTVYQRPGAEYFDALLWRLFDRGHDAGGAGYLLGVTGCARQSGVSTVAANLAIRAADHGLGPVLLVDANDHHPQLHRLIGAKSRAGLAEVLTGQASLAAAVQPTHVPGLQLLPLGSAGLLKRIRIDSARPEQLVAELRELYSLVLVDLPGACQMSHALWLAHALDGAVLVIRSERIGRGVAHECQRRLAQDGIQILGAVLTDQHTYLPNWLA